MLSDFRCPALRISHCAEQAVTVSFQLCSRHLVKGGPGYDVWRHLHHNT